jgi:ElaB/YqjD/DUF883 family membrane-anchored ribosome-binding protein
MRLTSRKNGSFLELLAGLGTTVLPACYRTKPGAETMDTDRISEAAESALEKTQDAAGRVKDALTEATERLAEAGSQAYDRGSELVERRPGSALLLAGIIGFALGVIFTRGSQPRRNSLQKFYDRYGP